MTGKILRILALCFLLCGCTSDKQQSVHLIDAQEAKKMMQDTAVIVIDVRTQEEYAQGHIPNAKLVPLDQIEQITDVAQKEDTVLVYCRSGNRSAQAAQYLIQAGYESVYDFGGILSWPYEIE